MSYTTAELNTALEKALNGGRYNLQTTFASDFDIANRFAVSKLNPEPIRDTWQRAFNEWRRDIIYLTDLAIVTNWMSWVMYDNFQKAQQAGNDSAAEFFKQAGELYADYYYQCRDYAYSDAFTEEEQHYYFECTD